MSSPSRVLVTACLISVGIILAAVVVRIWQFVPQLSKQIPVGYSWSHGIGQFDGPSTSFYDSSTSTPEHVSGGKSSSKTTVVDQPVDNGPHVTARAYLIGNVATGAIYVEHNATAVLPVASMSKIITAIAATDTMSPTTTILITPEEYDVASDTSRISAGEKFTVKELLYPLLLNSSNVAAEALASSTDRSKFLYLMSSYAWEIGMPSTFFADPTGISPLNRSTAREFFAMAKYLYKDRQDILDISRTVSMKVATTTDHEAHNFVSIHPFVGDPNFIGGKTGHTTEAKDTMLTIMKIGVQPIAVIVLGSDDRKGDTAVLIEEAGKYLAH